MQLPLLKRKAEEARDILFVPATETRAACLPVLRRPWTPHGTNSVLQAVKAGELIVYFAIQHETLISASHASAYLLQTQRLDACNHITCVIFNDVTCFHTKSDCSGTSYRQIILFPLCAQSAQYAVSPDNSAAAIDGSSIAQYLAYISLIVNSGNRLFHYVDCDVRQKPVNLPIVLFLCFRRLRRRKSRIYWRRF